MSTIDQPLDVSSSRMGPACPGHPVLERVPTRVARIGESLTIRRALPARQRRMVGAWCFLDHAGPHIHERGQGLQVGPHPHIGLQTFSWLIAGEVLHRDSLGSEQIIRPGQVNLMTAGRGISHSEDAVTDAPGQLHLAQLWIALPDAQRNCEPAFAHHPQLPERELDGLRVTVLAGQLLGASSPVQLHTPMLGLDLCSAGAARTRLPVDPGFEHAALVLEGEMTVAGEVLQPGTLLYLGTGRHELRIECRHASRMLLLGGTPFDEDVLLWWNFVARSQDEIEQAVEDWNHGRRFGKVIGSPSSRLPAPVLDGLRIRGKG